MGPVVNWCRSLLHSHVRRVSNHQMSRSKRRSKFCAESLETRRLLTAGIGSQAQYFAAENSSVHLEAKQSDGVQALHLGDNGAELSVAWQLYGRTEINVDRDEQLEPALPTVRIYSDLPNVSEGSVTPAQFIVVRSGTPFDDPLTVRYITRGDAINGTDYALLSGVITIPADAASATIALSPLADGIVKGDESATIEIQSSVDYELGLTSERAVQGNIIDDVAVSSSALTVDPAIILEAANVDPVLAKPMLAAIELISPEKIVDLVLDVVEPRELVLFARANLPDDVLDTIDDAEQIGDLFDDGTDDAVDLLPDQDDIDDLVDVIDDQITSVGDWLDLF